MKRGKQLGKKVKRGIDKLKQYGWTMAYIALFCFGAYCIRLPLISIIKTKIEIKRLKKEAAICNTTIREDSLLIENLKNDNFLERYARERYLMQGKNEQIFVVE